MMDVAFTASGLNRRTAQISLSATIAMSERAAQLRREGRDVISLSLGELDFATPPRIVDAAHAAALAGETRYTAADGGPRIKAAIRQKLQRDNGLDYPEANLHVASGCKQVIYNALAATLEPGDEVVMFAPYWVSYSEMVEFCGGRPVIVPTTAATGFMPDPQALATALTPRTRWMFLNSPNNPTGAVYPSDLLAELAQVTLTNSKALILSDEIYEHLVYDGRHVSTATADPAALPRLLIVNGVSKAYAMTGWRIGFGAGPRWLIDGMAKVQSQTAGSSNSLAQAAAAEALSGDQGLIPAWRGLLRQRRDRMAKLLAATNRLRARPGAGAFYIFADVSGAIGAVTPNGKRIENDSDLADYLLDAANVAVVPGAAFGASPYLRFSFALAEKRLDTACRRIVAACNDLTTDG
jgi:aspartate aminotransferase